MSNPTSNFGWQMPTNSDLVIDLPADFEVFGQAVDTSLADLKGGTTGQILSKASGTDMDFTWVAPTTGDITGVTAGTGLTGGGTSGSVTLDFDVANYGGGQFAAGKNKIINGDFGIWQRGTTFNSITGGQYLADRWCGIYVNGTLNVTQQSLTVGDGSDTYFMQIARTSTHASIDDYWGQKIEDVRIFAGQQVTISFTAKATSGTPVLKTGASQYFGSGGSSEVFTSIGTHTLSTSWVRYSASVTLPSISGKTVGSGNWVSTTFQLPVASGNTTIQIRDVQMEAGSTATAFQTATGTIQGELAACQRYYWRSSSTSSNLYAYMAPAGSASSSTNAAIFAPSPVNMRVVPTSVDFANLALTDNAANYSVTGLTINTAACSPFGTTLSIGSTGLTTARYYALIANNSSSAYLGLSAEL